MVFNTINSAASAVRAHARSLLVSAHNTANVFTEDFHPQRNVLTENPGGGVSSRIETLEDVDGVSLVEEATNQITSQRAIEANLAVIRNADKTLGVLIDIVG